MPLPHFQPMPLDRLREPFCDPDWVFEIKWDGFRALVHIQHGACKLMSRNGNAFKSFPALNDTLPAELQARSAVLDGEIVCLAKDGKPQFRDLLFRRGEPRFYAFDLLWCDGEDLRYLPLSDRKLRLRSLMPHSGERLLYCDHVQQDGIGLFRLACEQDLEGIVAKQKYAPYLPNDQTSWMKIPEIGSVPRQSLNATAPCAYSRNNQIQPSINAAATRRRTPHLELSPDSIYQSNSFTMLSCEWCPMACICNPIAVSQARTQ